MGRTKKVEPITIDEEVEKVIIPEDVEVENLTEEELEDVDMEEFSLEDLIEMRDTLKSLLDGDPKELEEYDIEEIKELLVEIEALIALDGLKENADGTEELVFSPLVFEEDEVLEIIESDEFKQGVKDAEYYVGLYTTLLNFGMDKKTVNEFVLSDQAGKQNVQIQKLNIEMTRLKLLIAQDEGL